MEGQRIACWVSYESTKLNIEVIHLLFEIMDQEMIIFSDLFNNGQIMLPPKHFSKSNLKTHLKF